MGRIQKKKDPVKKKLQRTDKSGDASTTNGGNALAINRPAPVPKKTPVPAKPKTAGGEDGFLQKSIQFLREVRVELKKVTWPSRKQTMGSTVVVIILVVIISLFLGVVDFSLSSLMRAVLP
jgi:preprotein translocase subunit SecE